MHTRSRRTVFNSIGAEWERQRARNRPVDAECHRRPLSFQSGLTPLRVPGAGCGRQAENVNRTGDGMAARDVDSAIAALSISGRPEVDAHPERCRCLLAPASLARAATGWDEGANLMCGSKRSIWDAVCAYWDFTAAGHLVQVMCYRPRAVFSF